MVDEYKSLLNEREESKNSVKYTSCYQRFSKPFVKLVILLSAIAMPIFFTVCYLRHEEWAKILPVDDTWVVLSSDLNMYYLLHVPVVTMYWRNLGVKTLLLITLKEGEEVDDDNRGLHTLLEFVEGYMGVKVIYLRNQTIPAGQFAQTVRSFAAGTEFAHTLDPDKTVFVTSDVDFFPSNLTLHIPKTHRGKEIMLYDVGCCGFLHWHGELYPMYIMITVGMTVRKWRDVIGLPHDRPVDSKFIDTYVNKTFDNSINERNEFWRWFLDQRFFSLKMKHWKDEHEALFNKTVETVDRKGQPRLERFQWPEKEEFKNMDVWKRYESAHIAPGIILDPVWETNLPFYEKILRPEQIRKLTQLRKDVLKFTDVKQIMANHYHPEKDDGYWQRTFHMKGMFNHSDHLNNAFKP
ncbi:unnamed protein product [Bursaphelenchus xylophilus]|uniref:(pine wood nematode) hypothetical protein n=1 Tax=Bursaphelenchus xylophilus TaxID=6326 RepID=A0A1I7RPC8_BURXY|nr:unnamed protein product [Bursaphelenchus xylophilus]CAG9095802.1 unnamed protein product [Bursaphelenchus xylophilus]